MSFLLRKYTALLHIIVPWVAKHILHLSDEITVFTNGSGDTTYDWVVVLFWLTMAALVTVVWSGLARKRTNHEKLFQWARVYLRLSLANGMIIYGAVKVFPLQMSLPSFAKLLQPYGDASPMGILCDLYRVFSSLHDLHRERRIARRHPVDLPAPDNARCFGERSGHVRSLRPQHVLRRAGEDLFLPQ